MSIAFFCGSKAYGPKEYKSRQWLDYAQEDDQRSNGRETAACQRRIRQQHAQERAQDYVETIADLIASYGEARATDLAKSLGVTHATVIRTVERLKREDWVTTQPTARFF